MESENNQFQPVDKEHLNLNKSPVKIVRRMKNYEKKQCKILSMVTKKTQQLLLRLDCIKKIQKTMKMDKKTLITTTLKRNK